MVYPVCGCSVPCIRRKARCMIMRKIVIVVENGMVTAVYGCESPGQIDVEILDMDTTDPGVQAILDERLETVRQYLTNLY